MLSNIARISAAVLFVVSAPVMAEAAPKEANESQVLSHGTVSKAEEKFAEIASEFPGMSASVYEGDSEIWTAHHGYESLANAAAIGPETKFNIYSTTKALTGIALAQLLERKGMAASVTIGEIAPDLPAPWHEISIANILSHRSGIRHYSSPLDWLQFAQQTCAAPGDAIAYFAGDELVHEPGSEEQYSSFAFVVASELLVRLSGKDNYTDALNDALGADFNFELDSASRERPPMLIDVSQLPEPMRPEGVSGIIEFPPLSAECKFGGGGIVSNASELARAGTLLFSKADGYSPLLQLDESDERPAGGVQLGAAVKPFDTEHTGITSYSLSGGAPGGRSFLLVLLEPQISVAITANFDGPNLEEAAKEIAKAWLDQN